MMIVYVYLFIYFITLLRIATGSGMHTKFEVFFFFWGGGRFLMLHDLCQVDHHQLTVPHLLPVKQQDCTGWIDELKTKAHQTVRMKSHITKKMSAKASGCRSQIF